MIDKAIETMAFFVLVFCILFLVRELYKVIRAVMTNGEKPFIAEGLTTTFIGLAISYIITYCAI